MSDTHSAAELPVRARRIRLAIFDVDGVLTDGKLYFLVDGSELKTFNTPVSYTHLTLPTNREV